MRGLALCFLVVGLAAAEEPWLEAMGPAIVDGAATQPALVAWTAPVVSKVADGSPAAKAGLLVGDRLIGIFGIRTHGSASYNLVRWGSGGGREVMPIAVVRGDRALVLETRPKRYRTAGFDFDFDSRDLVDQVLAIGQLAVDLDSDPLGYRAWLQFPMRELGAIRTWLGSGVGQRDRAWLDALDRQHRALCRQDFAAAAKESVTDCPLPELDRLIGFYAALAERHELMAIEPDPDRHGLDLVSWVRLYPYPLVQWPEVGQLPPAMRPLGAAFEGLRSRPAALGGTYPQDATVLRGFNLEGSAGHYVTTYGLAVLDPGRHGGWPYRHAAVWEDDRRAETLRALAAATPPEGCEWYLDQVMAIPTLMDDKHSAEAWDTAAATILRGAAVSPAIAQRGLQCLHHAHVMHKMWNARRPLREAFREGGFQLTGMPSPFLDRLQAHDAWDSFYLPDDDGSLFDEALDRALVAQRYDRSIEDLEAVVRNLPADTGSAQRAALMVEVVDRYAGWLTDGDVDLLAAIDGEGQATGVLVDQGPTIWDRQQRRQHRVSYHYKLRDLVWPATRSFDVAAVLGALDAIDWTEPEGEIEALSLAKGNLSATLWMADRCEREGHADLAAALDARVDTYLDACWAHATGVGWNGRWRAKIAWLQLVVYAGSERRREDAIEAGERYLRLRKKPEERWNCAWLSLAQVHLLAGNLDRAAQALAESFDGIEAEATPERFPWPDGEVVIGEPSQRLVILKALAAAGALDRSRGEIIARAKADLVPDGFVAVLGVDAAALGAEPPPPGTDDF